MPSSRCRRPLVAAALTAVALLAPACQHSQDYIWIDEVPKSLAVTASDGYVLGPGDVIGVRVFNQEASSIDRTTIRDDGKISLPLLYDVEVAGIQPSELARRLEVKLKPFVVNPTVTVIVHERRPLKISVLGEVKYPGAYTLERGAGVLQAIAAAGGLTDFAHHNRVFVLRSGYWAENGNPGRIRFNYDALTRGAPPGSNFQLNHGDTIVAE
jgi:polysaccharide export outer membrane protein